MDMKSGASHFSRRTAAWLVAIMAALVVIHFTYQKSPQQLAQTVMGHPQMAVALRGEITQLASDRLTVTLEDPHGDLTTLTRQIELSNATRYMTPGKPTVTGAQGLAYLKQGYRVTIRGHATLTNALEADVVQVSFPPLTGTIQSVGPSSLTLTVPGQSAPADIVLTSHTAFFFPNGDFTQLSTGSAVRVWVVPNNTPNSGLTAVTVLVRSQKS
ncbi:hypothetical protein TPY_0170 [Sulfobacillus acidophilus TPY]|nr:hypothetical protein TPY_0170 [Sulfobacillus acidophilus TPY]